MTDQVFLTEDGRRELSAELQDLIDNKHPHLAALLEEARRENTEREEDTLLAQSREELARVEQRIRELERLLRSAVTPPTTTAKSTIGIGTRVKVRDDEGDESSYIIVTPMEAQPAAGRISDRSPVGKALIGHRVGDAVVVQTPAGEQRLAVLEIG